MTLVSDLITAAYLRSSQNDPGKLAQDAELIGHANRVYQRTWALIARARPDEFSASTDLTLASVPPQVALPASFIDLLGVTDAGGATVRVIPATERTRRWHLAPCVYRVGMTLYSRAESDDPIAGDALTAVYLDAPPTLDALADSLDTRWPARHEQVLVDYLAVYLSVKDSGRSAGDRQVIMDELRQSVTALAAEYQLAPAQVGWIHADAERATG